MIFRSRPGQFLKPIIAAAVLLLLSGAKVAAVEQDPGADNGKTNYSIGYRVGSDMKSQGVDIDPKALLRGVQDAVSGHEPFLTRKEMRDALIDLQKRISKFQEEKTKQEADKNLAEGKAFLAENGKKEGVITLPSGLQYKVITNGSGRQPGAGDTVTVHYRGTMLDGTEFDSSFNGGKPATFRADHVIPGWKEALPLMSRGAKWQLFVPPALGYGERRNGRIGPNSTLIFEIELLSSSSNE